MNRIILAAFVVASAMLAACASTPDLIVGAPVASPTATAAVEFAPPPVITPGPILAKDLLSAAYNFDEAVKIGALSATDPAVSCIHDALKQAGLEGAAAADRQSFVPRKDGVVSLGATLYILAAQARVQASHRFELSPQCLEIVGRIHIDALKLTTKAGLAAIPGAISGGIVGDVHAIGAGVKMLEAMPKR